MLFVCSQFSSGFEDICLFSGVPVVNVRVIVRAFLSSSALFAAPPLLGWSH